MSDPWSDPSTPAEPGYTGPPPTTPPPGAPRPPVYGAPGYGGPGYGGPGYGGPGPYGQPYGAPPYGQPYGMPPQGMPPYGTPYGMPPYGRTRNAGRPGTVVGAAVLAFVQGSVVLVASIYVWFSATLLGGLIEDNPTGAPTQAYEFASLGTTLSIVQVVSVVLLVVGGILALTRRTRMSWMVLVAAHAVQVLIAVYWAVRLEEILGRVEDIGSVLAVFALFFAALPLVALGLVLFGAGRRWFTAPQG